MAQLVFSQYRAHMPDIKPTAPACGTISSLPQEKQSCPLNKNLNWLLHFNLISFIISLFYYLLLIFQTWKLLLFTGTGLWVSMAFLQPKLCVCVQTTVNGHWRNRRWIHLPSTKAWGEQVCHSSCCRGTKGLCGRSVLLKVQREREGKRERERERERESQTIHINTL